MNKLPLTSQQKDKQFPVVPATINIGLTIIWISLIISALVHLNVSDVVEFKKSNDWIKVTFTLNSVCILIFRLNQPLLFGDNWER